MTAINIVCQPQRKCLHIASDAASYTNDGVVQEFKSKVIPVQQWPGAITGRGVAIGTDRLAEILPDEFESFDDLIAGVEGTLEETYDSLGLTGHHLELFLAGWSADRQQPEAYVIATTDHLPKNCSVEQLDAARAAGFLPTEPFELLRLPNAVFGPPPIPENTTAAFLDDVNVDDEPAIIIQRLRKVLEIQRHDKLADGIHWVGGYGELTTITSTGVTQQRLQSWPDKVGQRLKTLPINWTKWCNENGMPPSSSALEWKAKNDELDRQIARARAA